MREREVMTKPNYFKGYADAFAIFAKYKEADILDLDYNSIGIHLAEEVTPEDKAKLLDLGWKESNYNGVYYKTEI